MSLGNGRMLTMRLRRLATKSAAESQVCALMEDDGTWSVYVLHVRVLRDLSRREAKARAMETPEGVVRGTRWEWQWRDRRVARERITAAY